MNSLVDEMVDAMIPGTLFDMTKKSAREYFARYNTNPFFEPIPDVFATEILKASFYVVLAHVLYKSLI